MLIQQWTIKEEKGDRAMNSDSASHRICLRQATSAAELRLGWHEYSKTAREVIESKCYIVQKPDGSIGIETSTPLSNNEWGFNAGDILKDEEGNDWPYKDLMDSRRYGCSDYAEDTPMICTDSPHERAAKLDPQEFLRCVDKDVNAGWLGLPPKIPKTVPFRVIPGSIVPKKDAADGGRLVWNNSWSMPNSYAGTVRNMKGDWVPIAANEHVHFTEGAGLEWTSIESNKEVISILADGEIATMLPLLEIIYDLKDWFLQLAIYKTDYWKQTCHLRGGFR